MGKMETLQSSALVGTFEYWNKVSVSVFRAV